MSAQFDQLVKKHVTKLGLTLARLALREPLEFVTALEEGLRAFAKDVFDLETEKGEEKRN